MCDNDNASVSLFMSAKSLLAYMQSMPVYPKICNIHP